MRKSRSLLFAILIAFVAVSVAATTDSFALGETSRKDYYIADGVTESTVYVTVDAGYNLRAHILRIEEGSPVTFKASYGKYYLEGSTAESRAEKVENWDTGDWTFTSVRAQAGDYENAADAEGEVIAASNGDFFELDNGEPKGSLVLEGEVIKNNRKRPFLAVLKNGKITIKKAGASYKNVEEAISGDEILLWNGEIAVGKNKTVKTDNKRMPREAIGICKNGTVVIVNIDGREPASAGATRKELAEIMKKQGCTKALNFDGGGSASFMTKRESDESLKFRGNHSDGPERQVSSALLIIKTEDNDGENANKKLNTVEMVNKKTSLTKDKKGYYRYRINGKGQTGFFVIDGKTYLFANGRGLSKSIEIGNVTYKFKKGRLKSSSDSKAGNVIIGYCGASGTKGNNLVYAYHKGNQRLIIGLNPQTKTKNGKMKNLTGDTINDMPWYSVRMQIKKVYIGDGVTNLGDYFLYSTKGKMVGGAQAPKCKLTSIRLPSSISKIGSFSLYNKPKLKNVKLPSRLKTIGKAAFMYSGMNTITFKSKSPPKIEENALKKTGFNKAYVRKSPAWKKFVKHNYFKKYGYKKAVKYN